MPRLYFNDAERRLIVTHTRQMVETFHRVKVPDLDIDKLCLIWSFFLTRAIHEHADYSPDRLHIMLQAGTALWPSIRPEDDDGVRDTHAGHVFEPDSEQTRKMLMEGMLPEIHVWVVLQSPTGIELIDLLPRAFKNAALERGAPWTMPEPPDYLWVNIADIPDRVQYKADAKAIKIARTFLRHAILDEPLILEL